MADVHTVNVTIPLLVAKVIERLPITSKGTGAMHKHGAAYTRFDYTDGNGNRYTGNLNVQVQSVDEVLASKNMPKKADGSGREKFNVPKYLEAKGIKVDPVTHQAIVDDDDGDED